MIRNIWSIQTFIRPIRFVVSQVTSVSLRTWQIARVNLASLYRRAQSVIHPLKAKEGGCQHFVDERIVSLWQNSLGFSSSPDRSGLENSLKLIRHESSGVKISDEHFEHLFNNQKLAPLLATIAKEAWSVNLADLSDLDSLERVYRRLYRRYGDVSAPLHRAFDPLLLGNLPYFWRTLEFDEHSTALIRMPVATRDLGDAFEITSEFQSYIKALGQKKERHLYVNLMDKTRGNEAGRSRALQEWAATSPPGLILASLDKNSAFYLSGGCHRKKSLHLAKLRKSTKVWLANTELHQWPFNFQELNGRIQEAQQVVEDKLLFPPNQILEQAICRTYLDLVQTELLHQLLREAQPTSVNISCKNCIDRGPCQQVLLSSWLDQIHGKPLFDTSKALLMLLPAWLVSGRAMQLKRFERSLLALRTLTQIQ